MTHEVTAHRAQSAAPSLQDRYRGALVGLAIGDALGAAVEFKPRGTFPPVTGMRGGGPHGLAAGYFTDDTSMALCLAESLLERNGFDAQDQMQRYVRWFRDGHHSSTGRCFDIGNTTRDSLNRFIRTGDPFAGPTDTWSAGNGSIMRLAPIPVFYRAHPERAIAMAANSSRTTHGNRVAVDACRYLAALIVGALNGASKDELLSPMYTPVPGMWEAEPLDPAIASVAQGSFKPKPSAEAAVEAEAEAVKGSGYSAQSLEAALWAFHNGRDFREGCLLAVNLGDDADTTGAVHGQLAGAHYGREGIPREWRDQLAQHAIIANFADRLYNAAASTNVSPALPGDQVLPTTGPR